jgi:hypothetical protein
VKEGIWIQDSADGDEYLKVNPDHVTHPIHIHPFAGTSNAGRSEEGQESRLCLLMQLPHKQDECATFAHIRTTDGA